MTGPLDGLSMIDCSRLLPGLYASALLADMGAEVTVKVIRTLGPPWKFARTPAGLRWPGASPGADGRTVLEGLGLAPAEIDALAGLGVVQLPGAAS